MEQSAVKFDPDLGQHPLRELLALAGPTIGQMASYTVMQFIDTYLLSRVGEQPATAASNAGGFAFALISFGFGVLWVVNTLVSQKFGEKQFGATGRYLWQGIWWAVLYSLLLLPLLPVAPHIFLWLGHEPGLAGMESTYIRIVMAASFFKLLSMGLGQFLLAVDRPRSVLVSAVIGVSANAVAAVLLVLHWGMGVRGAAWAQNIGVMVESLVLVVVLLQSRYRAFNVGDWRWRLDEMRTLLRVGIPSGFQVVTEVLAWMLFLTFVIARFGTGAMAANTFMMRYMIMGFMPCFGVAAAVTALVGRYIGMGRPDIAQKRAHLGFAVAGGYMAACGLVYYFARRPLIGVFTHDPQILRTGELLLTFAAIYEVFDAMYIIYNGALRGAGDTFVPAVMLGVMCWGINVFGGYLIARNWPGLGVAGPWFAATTYGILLGIFMLWRFLRGGWKTIHLDVKGQSTKLNGFPEMVRGADPTT